MMKKGNNWYSSLCGFDLRREYGKTPNGNKMNGRWVLRDESMTMIDFGQYRNDIAERNGISLFNFKDDFDEQKP